MDLELINQQIDEVEAWVVEVYKALHQHPELGKEEYRTSAAISQWLTDLEIPHQNSVAGTGIVGLISGSKPGRTVALRADMDALPIHEETGLDYASLHDGRMHACGHDAHMAIQLGAAKVLQGMSDKLQGNIKLLFQPDEETDGGAQPMIEAGCMEDPHVDYVLGLHVAAEIPVGQIMYRHGYMTASSDSFTITVRGRSAHAAYPDEGLDAIVMAGHLIVALQSVVSRIISPLDAGVITMGTIQGGTKENIIADRVEIHGTIRTLDPAVRAVMKEKLVSIADGVCRGMGGECEVEFRPGYMPIINHDEVVQVVEENARMLLGEENVLQKEKPSLGVEDFSFFCQKAPGAFYNLGCGNPSLGIDAPAHGPHFRIDERCLKIGVLLQVVNALRLLENLPI